MNLSFIFMHFKLSLLYNTVKQLTLRILNNYIIAIIIKVTIKIIKNYYLKRNSHYD